MARAISSSALLRFSPSVSCISCASPPQERRLGVSAFQPCVVECCPLKREHLSKFRQRLTWTLSTGRPLDADTPKSRF